MLDKSSFSNAQQRGDTKRQLLGKSQAHNAGVLEDKDLMPGGGMPPMPSGAGKSGAPAAALVVPIGGKGKPGMDDADKGDQIPPEMTEATADAGTGGDEKPPATIESLSQDVSDLKEMVQQLVAAACGGDTGGAL